MQTIKELEQLAKNGDGLACYILGRSYYSAENGVNRDFIKSLDYYEFGYKNFADPRCEYGYAMFLYDDGESEPEGVIEKNNILANKMFAEAYPKLEELARNGDMYSCFILGAYYNYGIGGIKKDFATAVKFIKQSANMGHSGACYDMGKFHLTGKIVKKDIVLAKTYFEKSKNMGNIRAKQEWEKL